MRRIQGGFLGSSVTPEEVLKTCSETMGENWRFSGDFSLRQQRPWWGAELLTSVITDQYRMASGVRTVSCLSRILCCLTQCLVHSRGPGSVE